MENLKITIAILNDVLTNKNNFYKSLRKNFDHNQVENSRKKIITAFSGCILRHYLCFNDLIKRNYKDINENEKYVIMYMLANIVFLKRLSDDEWIALLNNYLKEISSAIDITALTEFLQSKKEGVNLIDESIEKGSYLFCSLRFNTPLFLTKMWSRSFGKNLTFKIIKGNTKTPSQYVRLNELKMSKEEFEKKFSNEFTPTEYDGIYEYHGKNPLKRLPLYQNKKIFSISIGMHELVTKLDLDPIKPIAIYSGFYNPLFLDANVTCLNKVQIENLIEPQKDYHLFKNEMKQFGFVNNSMIECKPSSIIASLSKKVNTFVLFPSNSTFESLRLSPDYFYHFDPNTFDELIKNQKELLDEAKNFVLDGGKIVYVVNTISKKESELIIRAFLEENKQFTLEEEKQYFPFEKEDTTLYYAILRKGNND